MLISTEGWKNELSRLASWPRAYSWSNAWKNIVVAVNFAYQTESAHRCTGLLFITMRISHLATVARSRRIKTSLVNTKTILFHHQTTSIFYISVFKAVQPFTFKVTSTTMRLYGASIPRLVTFLIYQTRAWASWRGRAPSTEIYNLFRACGWLFSIFDPRIDIILIRNASTI